MAVLMTAPNIQYFDVNGNPLSGGKIFTYVAGTNTPKAAYTDNTGTISLTNPIILDAAGFPTTNGTTRTSVWVDGSYRYVVQDSAGVQIEFVDNVTSFVAGGVNTVDINGMTTNAAPALTDYIPTYDVSAAANAKVLVSDILNLVSGVNNYFYVRDEKASGTGGGSAVSGPQTRVLNTVKTNTITGATLGSNQISLPAGTYDIEASAPGYKVDSHQIFLYNVTDATIIDSGTSRYSGSSGIAADTASRVKLRIVLATTKILEVRHTCQTAFATLGLGIPRGAGLTEVYTDFEARKIA